MSYSKFKQKDLSKLGNLILKVSFLSTYSCFDTYIWVVEGADSRCLSRFPENAYECCSVIAVDKRWIVSALLHQLCLRAVSECSGIIGLHV